MALTVEDGSGVYGADTYAALATVDAYWTARPHNALAATWAAADDDDSEGAAREATAYLDATFGPYYRGVRAGDVQGLLFPRFEAMDDSGYPMQGVPLVLVHAVCELAPRALSARLSVDLDTAMPVKRFMMKAGSYTEDTEYGGEMTLEKKYGYVAGLIAPILDGTQPNAPRGGADLWAWR